MYSFIKFRYLTSREFSDKVLPYEKILPKELYRDLLRIFLSTTNPDSKQILSTRKLFQINMLN